MPRPRQRGDADNGPIIAIIAPGMRVEGDCIVEGTIRIDGTVAGAVHAGKGVVIGKDGLVEGDVTTQDAVISGRVRGRVTAASRLELQSTARVDGDLHVRRMQLEEGAVLNGEVEMGEVTLEPPAERRRGSEERVAEEFSGTPVGAGVSSG